MTIKLLLCTCNGVCETFFDAGPFRVESGLEVEYALVRSQLCGEGGTTVLAEILNQSAAHPRAHLVVGACNLSAQVELFRSILHKAGFDERRFVPVDIHGVDRETLVTRLRQEVERLVRRAERVALADSAG